MNNNKDWHAVGADDFRGGSSEEEDHSDFGIVKGHSGESDLDTDGDVADSILASSEASNNFGESDLDTTSSDAESDAQSQSGDSRPTGALETAFAAESTEAPEEDIPIDFDADEDSLEDIAGMEQDRWQMTDAYMRDMQQAFRERPAVRVQGNERYMKILLVGEHGLGKESFIKNVFAPYCADNDLPVNVCEVDTKLRDFRQTPSDYCTEVVIDVDEGRTKIHYHMQDTPGTHQSASLNVILEYVRNQNRDYMAMEEDSKRSVPLGSLPDPRVDVVLYFLSPFFLKPQDITAMSHLARFVPVVPLIAKADALTTAELTKYREEIKEQLRIAEEKAGHPIMHTFTSQQLKQAGAIRDVPPFAIITSSEIDTEVGRHWFTRTFPWGKCEVMSSNHSDLPALKSLLFEHCFESIKAATESRFYTARESFLTTRALSKAMSSKELPGSPASSSRPRAVLAESAAAVKASVPPIRTAKDSKPQKSSSWGWGWTAGLVTAAVLLQLLALTYYSRNMSSLKTLVSTYQAESAAEKQEIQEMLRSQLYAIEHKPSRWDYSHVTPVKEMGYFFSAAGASIRSASFSTASAIKSSTGPPSQAVAASISNQASYLGHKLHNSWLHTHHSTKRGFEALPSVVQNAAKSTGVSLKRSSGAAYRAVESQLSRGCRYSKAGLISAWNGVSRGFQSQDASFSKLSARVLCSTGCSIQSSFREARKGLSSGVRRTGHGLAKGFASMGKGLKASTHNASAAVAKGVKISSKRIASSCKSFAHSSWYTLRGSDRFFSHCGSSVASASKKMANRMAGAGKYVGRSASSFGRTVSRGLGSGARTTGHTIKIGALKTGSALKDFGCSVADTTQHILSSSPRMRHFDSWYKKNGRSITRALRRAAIANVLQ